MRGFGTLWVGCVLFCVGTAVAGEKLSASKSGCMSRSSAKVNARDEHIRASTSACTDADVCVKRESVRRGSRATGTVQLQTQSQPRRTRNSQLAANSQSRRTRTSQLQTFSQARMTRNSQSRQTRLKLRSQESVEEWLVNWDEEDSDDLGGDGNGRADGKPIRAAGELSIVPQSPCVRELERILYRPPVCNPHRFSLLAAKLIIAAAASEYNFNLPFCKTFSQLNDVNVEILDSQGTPQCLAGPDVQVDDAVLDALFVLYAILNRMSEGSRAQVYTETFVLATSMEPPSGMFVLPNGHVNDIAGLFTINSYLAQATTTVDLLLSLQQVGAIEAEMPSSDYQDQLDLSNFELIVAYLSYIPANQRYVQAYVPVLAMYNVTMAPNADSNVEVATFLYTLLNVLVEMLVEMREQQYPFILRTILQPSSLVYSFAQLEPISLVVNFYCFYAFTLYSPEGNVFRVVLSQQQGAMYSTACE